MNNQNIKSFIDDLQRGSDIEARRVSKLAIKNDISLTEDQAQKGYINPSNAYKNIFDYDAEERSLGKDDSGIIKNTDNVVAETKKWLQSQIAKDPELKEGNILRAAFKETLKKINEFTAETKEDVCEWGIFNDSDSSLMEKFNNKPEAESRVEELEEEFGKNSVYVEEITPEDSSENVDI